MMKKTKPIPDEYSVGICCDASHLTKAKVTEHRGVITATGEELWRESVKYSSVNVGEYLGLVRALQWVIENDPPERIIWCDSQTAISWFNEKRSASSIKLPEMTMADIWLQIFEAEYRDIEVRHWSKKKIGIENPADFGRK